jgi:hypothetical protein
MYPQVNFSHWYGKSRRVIYSLLFFSCLFISIVTAHPVVAHQVQISEDVGATLHIEPNDNPRAGEPTQAWFALTRKGGEVIPLTECDCELFIYAQPHPPGETALMEPVLQPVAAERYQGIPGAEITFPKPGLYQLQLKGKPKNQGSFQAFEFQFEVVVAAGTANTTQNLPDVNSVTEDMGVSPEFTIIFMVLVMGVVSVIIFMLRMQKGG